MRRVTITLIMTALLIFTITATVYADEESTREQQKDKGLTLQETVNRALMNSITVEKAEQDVDVAWETREALREGYIGTAAATHTVEGLYIDTPQTDGNIYFSFLAQHGQWRIKQKVFEITKDNITLLAKMYYYNIIENKQNLKTAKMELEKAESDYKITRARARAGMATEAEVKRAKSAVESQKSEIEQKKSDLEKSYRNMNKLIGFKPDERVNLASEIKFDKIEIPSLKNKISVDLSPDNNPYLFCKKESYEISKYTWTTKTSAEAGKIEKDQARLTYNDARSETRKTIYDLADDLKTLEASYESTREGIAAAEEALRVTEQMYEVGMVTKNDVLEKELALEQAQNGLLTIKKNYMLTREKFEKPWLETGGTTGNSPGGEGAI